MGGYSLKTILVTCISLLLLESCSVMDRMPSGVEIGSGVGERMGASFGRKNGNSAICAVIGAALVGSAGNVIDRYVAELKGSRPSLYVVNGVPYDKKAMEAYKKNMKDQIISISQLSPEEAISKYGQQGEKGAIVIALAENKDPGELNK